MPTRLTFNPLSSTFFIFSLIIISLFACKDDDNVTPSEMEEIEEMEVDSTDTMDGDEFEANNISGSSQKGPYLIGSTITIFELDDNLSPTGKSFAEDISDNLGSFEIDNLSLVSPFVELRASGFYFNEVSGENSEAQLNLSALVDLSNKDAVNVNILTTLEKNRVEFLIENGSTFIEAKNQALDEILQIFEIENANIPEADLLNISQSGEGNAILLAISAIIQSNNSVAVVSELISKISIDIEKDGVLDDESICIQLATGGSFVNPQTIRQNLENWYSNSGTSVSIPNFETFLSQFIQDTPCMIESNIAYPENGFHGLNLLAPENSTFNVDESYSMHAILEEGTSLEVKVIGNNWVYSIGQGDTGWIVGDWDADAPDIDRGRLYTAARTGSIDFQLMLTQPLAGGLYSDEIKFEIYENGSTIPTRVKTINIAGITPRPSAAHNLPLSPQSTTGPTENLLGRFFLSGFSMVSQLDITYKYGFAVYVPRNFEVELIVKGENFEFPTGGINQGWQIESIDPSNNEWRLTANGRGYYEAEIDLVQGQGCPSIEVEVFVNGISQSGFNVNNQSFVSVNISRNGDHGQNVLFQGNTLSEGDVSLAVDLDFFQKDLVAVLKGSGWSVPTPINNEKWEIENYDSTSQSQTFRATFDEYYFDGYNDLRLSIDPYNVNNPPEIRVEIYINTEECGVVLYESFDLIL